MKFTKTESLFIIITILIIVFSFENSYAEKTIPVEIKYTNGDIADFSAMKIIIYEDFDKTPIIEKKLTSNPENITIKENHRYKIEVYANGMYADVGYIQSNFNSEKLDITIPLSGGINFEVYYDDGQTPIKNANIVLKSQDNEIWGKTITNDQGETRRFWIQSTIQQDNYYVADIYLGEQYLTSHFPITISPGIAFTEKITTNIPETVSDLISVNLFVGSEKITSSDGDYTVILNQVGTDEYISSKVDFRGNSHFSNLNSGSYVVKVESNSIAENILWPQTIIHIIGNSNEFNIFKNTEKIVNNENPLQSCNCIAFRLDDVQDYWLSESQIKIINLFDEKNIPLSVGVIGGAIGEDEKITSILMENLEKKNIEIVNHSWDNDSLDGVSIETQEDKIVKANDRIFEVFEVYPTSFIPPQNLYDENTVLVLLENGFSHLVAHIEENTEIFSVNDEFYNVPATTETALLINKVDWELNDNTHIIEKTIESVHDNGYAIIMLHPQDFSLDSNGEYGAPNQEALSNLSLLLDEIKQLDSNIVKISNVKPNEPKIDGNSEEIPIIEEKNVIDSCNCIAFRLDDVQDYWLNDVQIKIMDTFSEKNTPLTIGILANTFGNDQKLTKFVKENIIENGGNLEIATKGIGLTSFTNYNKIEQSENLKESLDKIESYLDVRSKIFIPPDNKFNSDTLDILEENSITHISSSLINGDSPPFEFKNQKVYRFPLITSTGEYNPALNIFEGIQSQQTISESIQGISNYGYSVISLHPQEYSVIQNSTYTNSINQKQINELVKVIDEFTNQGYKIVHLGKINSNLIVIVPEWIKNNAGWWADGSIDDKTFVQGIEYLVQENIITVSEKSEISNDEQEVPEWIKNNAGWWADGSIDDKTFVQGIEYLVKIGIITY